MKTNRQIAEETIRGWKYSQPKNVEALLDLVENSKSFGGKFRDEAYSLGCSEGLSGEIANQIKAERVSQKVERPMERAERIDRYLRQTWITK